MRNLKLFALISLSLFIAIILLNSVSAFQTCTPNGTRFAFNDGHNEDHKCWGTIGFYATWQECKNASGSFLLNSSLDGNPFQIGNVFACIKVEHPSLSYGACHNYLNQIYNETGDYVLLGTGVLRGLRTSDGVYVRIDNNIPKYKKIEVKSNCQPTQTPLPLINVTLISPNQSYYNQSTIQVNISAPNASAVWFTLNGTRYEYPQTSQLILSNGTYSIIAFANNSENNISSSQPFTFNINPTIITPTPEPLNISNTTTNPSSVIQNNGSQQNVSINFTSNRFPLNITFHLYNSSLSLTNTQNHLNVNLAQLPVIYQIPANLTAGTYTLNMTVSDSLGNVITRQIATINVTYSNQNPPAQVPLAIINIIDPKAQTYNTTQIQVNISTINASAVWFIVNGITYTYPATQTIFLQDNLTYTLIAYANNSIGNISSANVTFTINVSSNNTNPQNQTNQPNITAPQISTVNIIKTNSTATITFTTTPEANTTISYWNNLSNILISSNPTFLTNHIILLNNLLANTTYSFNLTACNNQSNCTIYQDSFTTLENAIVNPPINPPSNGGGGGGSGGNRTIYSSAVYNQPSNTHINLTDYPEGQNPISLSSKSVSIFSNVYLLILIILCVILLLAILFYFLFLAGRKKSSKK